MTTGKTIALWLRGTEAAHGREEIPHIQGQELGHEGIHPIQGQRNPSKMAGTERGHQRADRQKPQSQKTKIMASGPITSWQIDGETVEAVADFILVGLQNHCRMVIAAMKLKDAYSLEGKL